MDGIGGGGGGGYFAKGLIVTSTHYLTLKNNDMSRTVFFFNFYGALFKMNLSLQD